MSKECGARLYLADDYGDGTATCICQLLEGHQDPHREVFDRNGGQVTITWEKDERQRCEDCRTYFSETDERKCMDDEPADPYGELVYICVSCYRKRIERGERAIIL